MNIFFSLSLEDLTSDKPPVMNSLTSSLFLFSQCSWWMISLGIGFLKNTEANLLFPLSYSSSLTSLNTVCDLYCLNRTEKFKVLLQTICCQKDLPSSTSAGTPPTKIASILLHETEATLCRKQWAPSIHDRLYGPVALEVYFAYIL